MHALAKCVWGCKRVYCMQKELRSYHRSYCDRNSTNTDTHKHTRFSTHNYLSRCCPRSHYTVHRLCQSNEYIPTIHMFQHTTTWQLTKSRTRASPTFDYKGPKRKRETGRQFLEVRPPTPRARRQPPRTQESTHTHVNVHPKIETNHDNAGAASSSKREDESEEKQINKTTSNSAFAAQRRGEAPGEGACGAGQAHAADAAEGTDGRGLFPS